MPRSSSCLRMICSAGTRLAIGLADDDGRIAGGQRERAFVLEFDGAGAVDEGEVVAEE